ncbi:MAG: hypothetical protein KDI88_00240 [Gammaproteobacteria bacterium]|nr:hypothetical protein [Gammaproteobacteria bacterium]
MTRMVPARPQWLDDEPEVVALLGAFLDKMDRMPASDRVRLPTVAITLTIAPRLHAHDEAADRTWALLRSLEGQLFEIRLKRGRQPFDPEYVGASLRFLEPAEATCRDWMDRPRPGRYADAWRAAVERNADYFADCGACLVVTRPVKVAGRSAAEVVDALARIGQLPSATFTLRQLSARLFWGHSKLLDAREDLLAQLFPGFTLAPRPVLLQVCLPRSCRGVLFVENLDSYFQAVAGRLPDASDLAFVYGAGFRGSAGRVRSQDGVSLHYQGDSDRARQAWFEAGWFGAGGGDWPAWFWGDLDFSGMAILKALRQRFGDVRAWQPGYAPMLQLLRAGGGHAPVEADKVEQADPGVTGCAYADGKLLPAMRELGRFVDQEVV